MRLPAHTDFIIPPRDRVSMGGLEGTHAEDGWVGVGEMRQQNNFSLQEERSNATDR